MHLSNRMPGDLIITLLLAPEKSNETAFEAQFWFVFLYIALWSFRQRCAFKRPVRCFVPFRSNSKEN